MSCNDEFQRFRRQFEFFNNSKDNVTFQSLWGQCIISKSYKANVYFLKKLDHYTISEIPKGLNGRALLNFRSLSF